MNYLNVIVLDDASANRILLGLLLRPLGHQVNECKDFLKVMELLKNDASIYTHLLLDISMPLMSRTDFCANLNKNAAYDHIRKIGYTAHAMSHESELILSAGFNDMLIKPITSFELKRALGLIESNVTIGSSEPEHR
ncbi:MAG: response regulator [Limnohabitans sp.]|nr:response regulator [Limnohabitans sp.]